MSVSTALLIAGALVLLAIVVGITMRARDGHQRSGSDLHMRREDIPGDALGSTALVQFSTELCARCPQVRRMLGEIAHRAEIRHAEIDLTHRADLATRYRVLQTPTTFLIDASGVVLTRWSGVPARHSIDEAIAAVPHPQKQEQV